MNQYNSYYLYQQYEKRGNQDWLPSYPNIFSVDGDGTMPLVMKKENDPDCGYTGDTEPIYRWYPLPITTDYICDECPVVQYRWENMNPSTDYYCDGTTKYYKQKRQYSYDSGTTWYDVVPPEYQQGSVYEQQSTDCGYVPSRYKLVATYAGGSTGGVLCDTATTLTSGETRNAGGGYTAMTNAVIGDCVTSIGNGAFANCRKLTSIDIPDSVTTIGSYAFRECSGLTRLNSNVDGVFNIPSGVTSIGDSAFRECSGLTSIEIPSGVTTIGDNAFEGCSSLTSIDIPDSVTTIDMNVFWNCTSLTSVTIPSGVTSIGNNAFRYCDSLTRLNSNVDGVFNIPSGVTSIGARAFYWCRSLTSIDIPNSVTSIGNWALESCSSLTNITVNATTPPALGTNAFAETNDCQIYVPSASVETYKSASGWSDYATRIQAIP